MLTNLHIAIVLTACGIETELRHTYLDGMLFANIAIVLTACGIETRVVENLRTGSTIAIVLTACGIETEEYPTTFRVFFLLQ